jgi:hypothetical protein
MLNKRIKPIGYDVCEVGGGKKVIFFVGPQKKKEQKGV